jgi:hypothetical protein
MGQFFMLSGCNHLNEEERDLEAGVLAVEPTVTVEITSKAELDRLWKRYIYHAEHILMGKEPFATADEADPDAIVRFCWEKYIIDHGVNELELVLEAAEEGGSRKIFPMSIAQEYSRRYFNLADIDLKRMDEIIYDADREGFYMYLSRANHVPYYLTRDNSDVLHEALRHADGRVAVTLHDYTYGGIVNRISQFTLMERSDGTLFITAGRKDYVEQRLVKIHGVYQEFAFLEELDQSYQVQMISEHENQVMIQTGNREMPVIRIDMDSLGIIGELKLGKKFEFLWAREKVGNLYVGLDDRVQVYDLELELIKEVNLPECMLNKEEYDYIHGYDISADLSKIAYTDNQGLKLVELSEGRANLIAPSEEHRFQNTVDFTVNYAHPRFVVNDTRILAVKTGYEGNDGYYLFDEIGTELIRTGAFEGISTTQSYPGQGMMSSIHTPEHFEDQAINKYRISYLDFEEAVTRMVDRELRGGYTGDIIGSDKVCNGVRVSAFLTRDYQDDIWYVNRIENETLEVEGNLLSIQHAHVELIGVLGDGRILFSYNRNPVEKGLGLIPASVLE